MTGLNGIQYEMSMNLNPIITGICQKIQKHNGVLPFSKNLKASLELPDLILKLLLLTLQILTVTDCLWSQQTCYTLELVELVQARTNRLGTIFPSPFVTVIVVMVAVVGPWSGPNLYNFIKQLMQPPLNQINIYRRKRQSNYSFRATSRKTQVAIHPSTTK